MLTIEMGPPIILDKSGLQSLPQRLRPLLSRYYHLVVPPVLVVEILGDLPKVRQGGSSALKMLAEKIAGTQFVINMDHRELRTANLLGRPIEMGGRPIVEAQEFNTSLGRAALVTETEEHHRLLRWQFERISNLDEQAANEWRATLASVDLETAKAELKQANPLMPKANSFAQLGDIVGTMLRLADQNLLLKMCVADAQIEKDLIVKIERRWADENPANLWTFAPYAFFCFRIRMLFHLGLVNSLVSTRSSNTADLLYLYYVPFCKVFSSNDKLHAAFSPLVLRHDQYFVRTNALRADFEAIAYFWGGLLQDQRKLWNNRFGNWPPRNQGSFTYQMWTRSMRLSEGLRPGNIISRMSPEAKVKFDEHAKEVMKAFRDIQDQMKRSSPDEG